MRRSGHNQSRYLIPEVLERFKAKTLKREPKDQSLSSTEELITALDRKPRR